MSRKGKSKSEEAEVEPIMEPHEHDVLCGRGGLTNHHPGNAWYRRLVRSNRPLYRDSPKHTKLLVAKAIVHHVQNQTPPGRFLECKRSSTGMWYPVSYKRAVDKTSQALREKDRENEGAADEKILQKMKNGSSAPSNESLNQTYVNNVVDQSMNDNAECAPPPTKVQRTSSWFWQQPKPDELSPEPPQHGLWLFKDTSFLPQQSGVVAIGDGNKTMNNFGMHNPVNNGNNVMNNSINMQQSGMNGIGVGNNNMNNIGVGNNNMNNFPLNPRMNPINPPLSNQRNIILNNNHSYNFGTPPSSGLLEPDPITDTVPEINRKRSADEAGLDSAAPAPPLTRMATQVSDWLSTFWPVGNEMKQEKETSGTQQKALEQQTAEQLQAQILQMQEQLRKNNELLQQNGIRVDDKGSSSNNAFAGAASAKLKSQQPGGSLEADTKNSSPTFNTESEIHVQMQELHERMKQKKNDNGNGSASDTLSPTKTSSTSPPSLAANVSSSILHLASTPSRLLAGLSSFFAADRRASQVEVMAAAGIDAAGIDGEGGDNNMKSSDLSDLIGDGASDDNLKNNLKKEDSTVDAPLPTAMMPNSSGLLAAPSMSLSQSLGSTTDVEGAPPSFGRRTSNRSLLEDDDED
eukprot:CAMPEP_0178910676 /NCGR_PEP_ID=MMETSP0786-20121207/9228_1 /TAXON_ID=186022 /ORGANISM="Thalassionema frauenfeldii, Strain CCMP 1798" /LENGTH=630 /DNA_ID=CAMNT_0020582951 /DNA_START=20 /DNA_END=1913 /DNA_ORIENTATION=+